jgi:transcriptional regulator with XRE-family HTH domain
LKQNADFIEDENFNENVKAIICQNIKRYRKEKGVRLMELAEKLDLSVNHLKRIESENDRNNISLITLYKISILLDVRVDKFFEEVQKPVSSKK